MLHSNDEKDPSLFSAPPTSPPPPSDIPPIERSLTCQSRILSPTECAFDWVLKVLGVLSAILFGIWAPVSYQLQVSGNSSNDVTTDQVMGKIDAMTRELAELKGKMESLAVMRAWEFCLGKTKGKQSLDACEQLQASLDINSLIAQIMLNKNGLKNQEQEEQNSDQPSLTKNPETASHNTLSMRSVSQKTTSTPTAAVSPEKEMNYADPHDKSFQHDELGDYPVITPSYTVSGFSPGWKPYGFSESPQVIEVSYWNRYGLTDPPMALVASVLMCVFVVMQTLRWSARARKERE